MEHTSVAIRDFAPEYLAGLKAVLDSLSLDSIQTVVEYLSDAYRHDRRIFVAGNGGSAATASHMACDLAKTVLGHTAISPVRRFKVTALTDNVPLITAWGNDASYETIFAQQLRNLASRDDLLVVITGSGNSPNIVEAVKAANELGLKSLGLLGFDGGVVRELLDCAIVVNSANYGYLEDAHMALNHLFTAYFKACFLEQQQQCVNRS
ncbi:MAG TPA: SIS domain-containing protein [Chloroflexota bacterium]|jgi:D-sedoheptulose 7-phosphate isomerase|nr:SIS domain-containing protein [Chloroflexota bacterium]